MVQKKDLVYDWLQTNITSEDKKVFGKINILNLYRILDNFEDSGMMNDISDIFLNHRIPENFYDNQHYKENHDRGYIFYFMGIYYTVMKYYTRAYRLFKMASSYKINEATLMMNQVNKLKNTCDKNMMRDMNRHEYFEMGGKDHTICLVKFDSPAICYISEPIKRQKGVEYYNSYHGRGERDCLVLSRIPINKK